MNDQKIISTLDTVQKITDPIKRKWHIERTIKLIEKSQLLHSKAIGKLELMKDLLEREAKKL